MYWQRILFLWESRSTPDMSSFSSICSPVVAKRSDTWQELFPGMPPDPLSTGTSTSSRRCLGSVPGISLVGGLFRRFRTLLSLQTMSGDWLSWSSFGMREDRDQLYWKTLAVSHRWLTPSAPHERFSCRVAWGPTLAQDYQYKQEKLIFKLL